MQDKRHSAPSQWTVSLEISAFSDRGGDWAFETGIGCGSSPTTIVVSTDIPATHPLVTPGFLEMDLPVQKTEHPFFDKDQDCKLVGLLAC